MEDGKLKSLKLLHILKSKAKSEAGLPHVFGNPEKIFKYLGEMSKPYGVSMKLSDDGLIECFWK